MRIEGLDLLPFQMTFRDRGWRTSAYTAKTVDAVAVMIRSDEGVVGLGATSIFPTTGDTLAGYQALLTQHLGPLLRGRDPFEIGPIMAAIVASSTEAYRVHTAIDLALHDLKGKALGIPVYELLGGCYRKEVPVIRMVGLKEPILQARSAAELVDEGYRLLKLKIGGDPAEDVQRVTAVRRAVGDSIMLTVDANGAYDIKTAIRVIRELEALNVAAVEDPVINLEDMARVTDAVGVPVMADTAVSSHGGVLEAIRRRAADVVSLKVRKLGLWNSARIRGSCEGAGMRYHLGGGATTRIIEAAALHFAVASPYNLFGCEVGEFEALEGDVVAGLEVREGMLRIPDAPGLGLDLPSHLASI